MPADRVTLCPAAWLHGFVGEGGLREPDVLPGGGTSWDRWGVQVPHGRFRRARRPLLAAVLSCLLPGAGQLYLGRRRRGWTMLAITAGCVAMAVGLLVFRAVAVVDAYLLATRRRLLAPPGRVRRSAAVGLVAILALTAAPHA